MGFFDGIQRRYVDGPNLDRMEIHWPRNVLRLREPDELLKEEVTLPCSFWYPKIKAQFSSPMVNTVNLEHNNEDLLTLARVRRNLKPIGIVSDPGMLNRVSRYPEIKWKQWAGADNPDMLAITRGGPIREIFDLYALRADYRAYFADAPVEIIKDIERELSCLIVADMEDYLSFRKIEVTWQNGAIHPKNARWPGSLMRCGLLLGYPIETTVALIRADYGLSGGHHTY